MEQDGIVRAAYPVAAADWIAAHPELGSRMFNSYGWGGYLAYRFYQQPERRVAIFGEAALMGDDHLRDYADVIFLHPNWRAQLDRGHVDYVLFNRGAPLAHALAVDARWKLVYEDSVAVVYARA